MNTVTTTYVRNHRDEMTFDIDKIEAGLWIWETRSFLMHSTVSQLSIHPDACIALPPPSNLVNRDKGQLITNEGTRVPRQPNTGTSQLTQKPAQAFVILILRGPGSRQWTIVPPTVRCIPHN